MGEWPCFHLALNTKLIIRSHCLIKNITNRSCLTKSLQSFDQSLDSYEEFSVSQSSICLQLLDKGGHLLNDLQGKVGGMTLELGNNSLGLGNNTLGDLRDSARQVPKENK